MRRAWILVLVVAVVACKKDKAGGGGGGGGGTAGGDMPSELEAWMPKDAGTAWQGAWISRLSLMHKGSTTTTMAGDPVAFEFAGPKVKMFDGEKEATLDYTIHTPCEIEIVQPAPDVGAGATYQHHKQFVVVAGHHQAADGAAGYRKGKAAIACVIGSQGGTYTLDDKGTCLQWTHMFHWDKKPATCTWSTENGKDVLTIGTGEWASKLVADGDVLEEQQFLDSLKAGYHERATDFAAAKAKVLAMDKEHPVTAEGKAAKAVEVAKAAGGKVGETSTVASLAATFGTRQEVADRQAGRAHGLLRQFVDVDVDLGLEHDHELQRVDLERQGQDGPHRASCAKAAITGFTQWDQVTVKGTVGESFDAPEVDDCSLTKAK